MICEELVEMCLGTGQSDANIGGNMPTTILELTHHRSGCLAFWLAFRVYAELLAMFLTVCYLQDCWSDAQSFCHLRRYRAAHYV
jgi:hypothetical protein